MSRPAPRRETPEALAHEIRQCGACAAAFAATDIGHAPRPVVHLSARARILVTGQAPGARVHASGLSFDDASGDRLRAWMGIDRATFYDADRIAIASAAFCFPGYSASGSDLPPPRCCARLWRARVLAAMPQVDLTLLIGRHAHALAGTRHPTVTEAVRGWREGAPSVFVLPHPSWRNTGWLRRNPWFAEEVLPALRAAVAERL